MNVFFLRKLLKNELKENKRLTKNFRSTDSIKKATNKQNLEIKFKYKTNENFRKMNKYIF